MVDLHLWYKLHMGSFLEKALCCSFGSGLESVCRIFASLKQGWAGGLIRSALLHLVSSDSLGIADVSLGHHCSFVFVQGDVLFDEFGSGFVIGSFS